MKIYGIVAEYNPFHLGHAYHIAQTRRKGATHIVAVMSGHFVQRGEPSIIGKFSRARMALENGVDLVLELPLPWSMSSAEGFAFGAVSILHGLGCVDGLSFGSECGDLASLKHAAAACDHPDVLDLLPHYLGQGLPFPTARQRAVAHFLGEDLSQALGSPNDQLGIEYLRALTRLSSSIQPICIPRAGVEHDQEKAQQGFASASLLRHWMTAGEWEKVSRYQPSSAFHIVEEQRTLGAAPASLHNIERCILARLRTMSSGDLALCPDVSEGLEHRILKASKTSQTLPALYDQIKTKRYTHSRIRRICMAALLGIPKGMAKCSPPYARILGMNKRGREIVSLASQTASLPLIGRSKQLLKLNGFAKEVFELERQAGNVWGLCTPQVLPCDSDLTCGLIVK